MKKFTIYFLLLLFPSILISQSSKDEYYKETVGQTYYDLQTWRAMQSHIYAFDDHTFGIVWNQAENWPGFSDQGIGYSYYNGSSWQGLSFPNTSITSVWARFPSYTAFGEFGELCFSQGQTGLVMSRRQIKGQGNWIESYASGTNFKHPCVVTSGLDHSVIQLLYLDPDENFIATPAQPMRGSIRYSRSTDGGISWDPQNQQFNELDPSNYLGFTVGAYTWVEPRSNILAFVAGDFLTDLVLMKSTDGGNSWQKTVIWEHPYPFLEMGTINTDTFYCNDGGISVALDNDGKAHVAFTLTRVFSSTLQDTNYYVKEIEGVVYWNEDRETFSNNINALNPYGHPDSELIPGYNLIGSSPDTNGKDEIDFGTYPTPGMSTMPQILVHNSKGIVVTWSNVTENYNFGTPALRHLWLCSSVNDGEDWSPVFDLNSDIQFVFSENVYPSMASDFSSDNLFYTFQEDLEAGLSGGNSNYPENNIWFLPVPVDFIPNPWALVSFYTETTSIDQGDTVPFFNTTTGYPANDISYEWYFEGGEPMISFEPNPLVIYPLSGNFDVILKASFNGILLDSLFVENYIHVLPAISIPQTRIDSESWEIIPNPSSGEVTITGLDQFYPVKVRVVNLLGHEVFVSDLDNYPRLKLNLDALPNGLYFVVVNSGENALIKKLVLSR